MEHIDLPVFDRGQLARTREVLEVERIDGRTVRLLHSPAYVDGIAAGDVIELDAGVPSGFRVVSRSGNLAIVFVFPSDEAKQGGSAAAAAPVEAIGGRCEGGPARVLVFSVAVAVGFPRVDEAMKAAVQTCPGSTWWFGNVFVGDSDMPLGWWEPQVR